MKVKYQEVEFARKQGREPVICEKEELLKR